MKVKVGIIDYGVGNLGSVLGALDELRISTILVDKPSNIRAADCLILPGVGNFNDCASLLNAGGWISALKEEVMGNRRPLLGVCVGMQLLADNSSEGGLAGQYSPGLGFIPGQVRHLRSFGCTLRVPHVGWNGVRCTHTNESLFKDIPNETDFYFVHSYAFDAVDAKDILAVTDYGVSVTAAVRRENVWGTQFHPEKSSRAGSRLLKNFIESSSC